MAKQPNAGGGPSDAPKAEPRPRANTDADAGAAPPRSPADSPIDAPSNRLALPARAVSLVEPAAEPAVDLAAASGLRRQVFGFLPYWEVPARRPSSTTTSSRPSPTSRSAPTARATSRSGRRRHEHDRLGRLDELRHDLGHQRRPPARHPRRPDGQRVRVDDAQASVQRALLGSATARTNLARQIAAAVRDRGADGVNLDFEPLASGYADEFVALLRTSGAAEQGPAGYQLTYDTTGYIGNYPLEASVGRRRRGRDLRHGLRLPHGGSATPGRSTPLSGPGYDLADTVRAYTARVARLRIILGLPWYGRAWSTATDDAARRRR